MTLELSFLLCGGSKGNLLHLLVSVFLLQPQKFLALRNMTNHVTCGLLVSSHTFCKYEREEWLNREGTNC